MNAIDIFILLGYNVTWLIFIKTKYLTKRCKQQLFRRKKK